MKKQLMIFVMALMPFVSQAKWVGNLTIAGIVTSGAGSEVAFTTRPEGTCNYFSSTIKFDSSTDSGKTLLTTLLTAHVAERKVDIWFHEVPAAKAGTDCEHADLARLFMVRVK